MKKTFFILLLISLSALASDRHHWAPPAPTVTEVTNVTDVVNVTELTNTTDIVNEYNNYVNDRGQGVAIAMAGANNQMYLGTHKPQLSLGIGECGGEVAGSIMFGMKPCKNCPLINGSIAIDNDVDAYGIGGTWLFK